MRIINQNSFEKWDIEDNSVQAIITSPPYYSLRKYSISDVIIGGDKDCKHEWGNKNKTLKHKAGETNPGKESWFKNGGASNDEGHVFCIKCNAWQGQYGLEPDYKLYLEHTMLWLKEAWRVLMDDGCLFLNIADSYSGSNCGSNDYTSKNRCKPETYKEIYKGQKVGKCNIPSKSKLLIPERITIALVDEGWIIRNHLVWFKPNGLPESVTDRFNKKWESIIFAVKNPKYYFNLDAVREIIISKNRAGIRKEYDSKFNNIDGVKNQSSLSKTRQEKRRLGLPEGHPKGKNPGDVWLISTQPAGRFKVLSDYVGIDGKPYRASLDCPIYEHRLCAEKKQRKQYGEQLNSEPKNNLGNKKNPSQGQDCESASTQNLCVGQKENGCFSEPKVHSTENHKISGHDDKCTCQVINDNHFAMFPEKLVERMILCSTKPNDIVLDPFCGSGTTIRVADKFNRVGIGIDLEYKEIQQRRCTNIQKELLCHVE